MKTKTGSNNQKKIDWKAYKEELNNRETKTVFNEYERDLHTMKVKDDLIARILLRPDYRSALEEMEAFDVTDLDLLKYEKELNIGEFN